MCVDFMECLLLQVYVVHKNVFVCRCTVVSIDVCSGILGVLIFLCTVV